MAQVGYYQTRSGLALGFYQRSREAGSPTPMAGCCDLDLEVPAWDPDIGPPRPRYWVENPEYLHDEAGNHVGVQPNSRTSIWRFPRGTQISGHRDPDSGLKTQNIFW